MIEGIIFDVDGTLWDPTEDCLLYTSDAADE